MARKGKSANIYWMIIICLGCFLPGFDTFALDVAGETIYTDDNAHFSIVIPAGFREISQEWLCTGSLDSERRKLCEEALKNYSKTYIYLDDSNRKAKGLVLIGIKIYKHKKKRFKLFTDYLTIDEFFDPKLIKEFRGFMKKKLGEKGAEDVIAGDPVFDKENKSFGFICNYRLSGGDEAKEFHRVFLGGTHLIYLDLNLYATDNTAPYESLFHQIAASLSFEEGFGPRDSYIDAWKKRAGSYELLGTKLSDLGRSLLNITLIIFLLNILLGYITNPKKWRYIQIKFLQRNKIKARLATIAIGILIYIYS